MERRVVDGGPDQRADGCAGDREANVCHGGAVQRRGAADRYTSTTRRRRASTFCAEGDTLTIGYSVQVSDGHVTTAPQPLNFVITGTDNAPVLSAIPQLAFVPELPDAWSRTLIRSSARCR